MMERAQSMVIRTDCLLKDAEGDCRQQAVSDRITQAREDLAKIKSILSTAKTKAAAVSKKNKNVATGSRAKATVLAGRRETTDNNLKQEHLKKNNRGKVVTKAASTAGAAKHKHIAPWNEALKRARANLGTQGFCPVGGKTRRGKDLLKAARKELRRMERYEPQLFPGRQ